MSLAKTVTRSRRPIKATARPAPVISMADVDALVSVALDLEAAGLFLGLRHYVDEGAQRQNHIEILLDATTTALRRARSTFEVARRSLAGRVSSRRR